VLPRTLEAVEAAISVCRAHGAPITSRGGGTSLAGQCCNVSVVIDFSKYLTQIIEINAEEKYAWVQPGVVLDDVRNAAAEHGLTFGPDPSTHNHNTLGGMIGNNSCGIHSLMAGRTADNVIELEVLTYDGCRMVVGRTDDATLAAKDGRDGEVYRQLVNLRDKFAGSIRRKFPDIPRRVSGYCLDELLPEKGFNVARALVGSEGTCVTVLRAKLRLIPVPSKRTIVVLGFHTIADAADAVPRVLKYEPIGLEGMDDKLVLFMRSKGMTPEPDQFLPEGNGWLLVELGAPSKEEACEAARRLGEEFDGEEVWAKHVDDPDKAKKIWEIRKSGLGATAHVPFMHDTHPGWEDSAVPPDRLGDYLRQFRRLLDDYGYECSLYGHFGDGCVHCRIDFDFKTLDGVNRYLSVIRDAADLVVAHGGSRSGEHGDGQSRAALLERMYGEEVVGAFRRFKEIWAPAG
jgi:FAD/FMN-containing dehydrogenase